MKNLGPFIIMLMLLGSCGSNSTDTAMQDKLQGNWQHTDTAEASGIQQVSTVKFQFMPNGKGTYTEDVHSLNAPEGETYFIITDMPFDYSVEEHAKTQWLIAKYGNVNVKQSATSPLNKEEYIKANTGRIDTTAFEITPGDSLILYDGEEQVYFKRTDR